MDGARGNKWRAVILVSLMISLVVLGGTLTAANKGLLPGIYRAAEQPAASAVPVANLSGSQSQNPLLGPNTIADIVEKTGPSVIKVETLVQSQNDNGSSPFSSDPFFREFFGDQFDGRQQPEIQQGLGSGFIVSKDGYILTNEHVVDGATEIRVTVNGFKDSLKARLVGSDYDLDLAVLKIDAGRDLPALQMGESDRVRVGDWVIAIGNPYGLDHTVTVGVISAKGRPVTIQDRQYKNLLQTDASINPGNSGGPLLNLQGEVVGINTAINAQAQGIGFAIPTSTVKSVFTALIKEGKVTRPWLGVYVQAVNKELAQYFGLDKVTGAVVASVVKGGPADQAGLRQGDVIQEFNRHAVKDDQDLISQVTKTKVGDRVVLLVVREGKTSFVTVTIGQKANQH